MRRSIISTITKAAAIAALVAGMSGTALAAGGPHSGNRGGGGAPGTPTTGTPGLTAPGTRPGGPRVKGPGPGGPRGRGRGGKHGGHGHGPGMGGPGAVVTAVNGSTITATTHGVTETIQVSATTAYTESGSAASASDVTVGSNIRVIGARNGDGGISATAIIINLPHVRGVVTAINGDSLTITRMGPRGPRGPRGPKGGPTGTTPMTPTATTPTTTTTTTVLTTGATTYVRAGQTSSFSAISTGTMIDAQGSLNSDGSLTARRITIGAPRPVAPAEGGPGTGGPATSPTPAPSGS